MAKVLVSECCGADFDEDEGRCRECYDGCVGKAVCNECAEDWEECTCKK